MVAEAADDRFASADDVPPAPAALIESMRAFGYSLPTAIADLVDNSISAHARDVDVTFRWAGARSLIAVRDDGDGMDAPTLVEAMRLGSRSPTETRAPDDLGRFGLGLKSAAWSQARRLTVISRVADGPQETRCWDLEHVRDTGQWSLLRRASEPVDALMNERPLLASGTVVVLEHLDRLVGEAAPDDASAERRFLGRVRSTDEHLAMVFHRFMRGRERITIRIDGTPVEPWDPFLEDEAATQPLPTEDLRLMGRRVHVAPYVLPHVSKLTAEQHRRAAGPGGWNQQQGFYIYRARRLLVAGGWLGLTRMQREEHYKLARVRVDLDNAMDEAWQIDVRKATARIPGGLEDDLRRIATVARQRAAEAYRFRGKAVARAGGADSALRFVWQTRRGRGGATSFRVNRAHPVLTQLRASSPSTADAVETALRLVEENLPIETIVMESREYPDSQRPRAFDGEQAAVLTMLRSAHAAMVAAGMPTALALTALANIEPFDAHPEVIEIHREEIGA